MNLPNTLTILRIVFAPVLVIVMLTDVQQRYLPALAPGLLAILIFSAAAATDWLDGYLARRFEQVTPLGQMLDPLADKVITAGTLLSLVRLDVVPLWVVFVMLSREVVVTIMRSIAGVRGAAIPPSRIGKAKMAAQVVAILLLLVGSGPLPWILPIGRAALALALIAALVSGVDYYRRFQTLGEPSSGRRRKPARSLAEREARKLSAPA